MTFKDVKQIHTALRTVGSPLAAKFAWAANGSDDAIALSWSEEAILRQVEGMLDIPFARTSDGWLIANAPKSALKIGVCYRQRGNESVWVLVEFWAQLPNGWKMVKEASFDFDKEADKLRFYVEMWK